MASTCPAIANAFDLKVKFAECFRLLLSNVTVNLHPSVERTHFFSPTVRSGVGYSLVTLLIDIADIAILNEIQTGAIGIPRSVQVRCSDLKWDCDSFQIFSTE